MNLHDTMHDAVDNLTADLPALTTASRRRGLAIRRRRQALSTVGPAAIVIAIIGGGYTLSHDTADPSPRDRVASEAPFAGPATAGIAPITGPGTAAALTAAIEEVADGTFSGPRGQGPMDIDPTTTADNEVYADVLFSPATGGPAGLVGINLQDLSILEEECRVAPCPTRTPTYDCTESFMVDCAIEHLPGGDVLRTYTDLSSGSAEDYRRLVAELLSPARHLRIVVAASNTSTSEKSVVRRDPVLDHDQLRAVATQPWWDLKTLPSEYVEAGRNPRYEDLNGGT